MCRAGLHDQTRLTGVLGRDLGVLAATTLFRGGVPLCPLGVELPLPLSLLLLTGLRTLQPESLACNSFYAATGRAESG